ncbi:HD-GYP domain-containing protein [Caloramator sp. E03]|uniref:HD-GYP domain-containing protein n=1 Tax=Caloramator sp. E03 TaxID=2576307 RepID=UPI00143D8F50|nr:HD domain-containing phosphohydrolase [Caloramator sp. E03]
MLNINLNELISSLAIATDLSHCSMINDKSPAYLKGNQNPVDKHRFFNHSKRTSYVSMSIAKLISLDKSFLSDVYISSTLHDIGVTCSIDECHSDEVFIKKHCLDGENILKKFPINFSISEYIKYHHENFDGSGSFGLYKDEIPLISQIIRLSDTFEILYDETKPNYFQRDYIKKFLLNSKKSILSPDIVDIFMEVESKDMFWWDVDNLSFSSNTVNDVIPKEFIPVDLEFLKAIAEIFAEIIDNKSPFTFKHSYNLSKLCEKVADHLKFDSEKKIKFIIAALLHDLGKLAIPNSILNKNEKLNDNEMTVIKSHTYYTYLILSKIKGLEEITSWAANHHEKLNGEGYPRRLKSEDLCFEDRLLAICDIFEALTSKRPYKEGISKDKAFKILDDMALKKEICGDALSVIKQCF